VHIVVKNPKTRIDIGNGVDMQKGICVLMTMIKESISVLIYALLFARHGRRATVRKWWALHRAHANAQTAQLSVPQYSRAEYSTFVTLLRIEQQKPIEHLEQAGTSGI